MEPGLKLILVQGPRSGETLEFEPGATIRIGRIVRGNNVTIKDAGISSKHLIIGFESGKWTVQDLGSSNGTALNSSKLPPHTPVELHENDTVKLGEYTSISIKLMTENSHEESVKPRRNPTRQVNVRATRSRSKKNEECLENEGLIECGAVEKEVKITRKGRGKRKILQEMPPENSEVVQIEGEEELKPQQMPAEGERVQIVDKGRVKDIKENDVKIIRKGRGRQKALKEMPLESCEVKIEGKENLEAEQVPGERDEVQTMDKENVKDVKEKYVKITRKARTRRKGLQEMPRESSEVQIKDRENLNSQKMPRESDEVHIVDKENTKLVEVSGRDVKEISSNRVEDKENVELGEVSGGDVKKSSCNKVEDKEKFGDLETMTLEQWFHYMEVYLPKQIIEATEEMIVGMKMKAERVRQYVIEEKKKKGKQCG
ncbi:FHA domain-containing protein At4g14490-like isoform X2 [Pistacia vera]|uniref:FHA domain-containing protein At4g14490-like isoform X2 n=1 Tax=Pistacia vera TaxID=55513 RepID=UPI001263312B|nr:FHA domain-containing protein At4g14490-like isoform X2 [Pistacia vera]